MASPTDYEFRPEPGHPVMEGMWRLDRPPGEDRIAPDTRCELILHLGRAPSEFTGEAWRQQPEQMLYGPLSRVLALRFQRPARMFAVRLRPEGIGWLDAQPTRFRDRSAPLASLLAASQCEALSNAASKGFEAFSKAAANVLERGCTRPVSAGRIRQAIDAIERQPDIRSTALSTRLGISIGTLDRDFRRMTGLTPGEFSRIYRYHLARRLVRANDRPLSDVAVGCGYADQAHMTREFRHFAGVSPRATGNAPELDVFYD